MSSKRAKLCTLLISTATVALAAQENVYIVPLEAPSTSSSIYGMFNVGGQDLKMTIGTNAGYTAVVGVACNSCGSEIKAPSAYTQSYTAFKPSNVTLTSRTQINPYLPGVNDRIFDGYVLNDKFCDTDETGLCKRDGGMNFFLINNLVNGFDLTSYGRLGLDYNPDRDAQIPSFASYLK